MKQFHLFAIPVMLFACTVFQTPLIAASANEIKANMNKRLPSIQSLKKSGLVGEDNKGYLAVVSGTLKPDDKAIVDAENADRKAVYSAIAKKQSTSVDFVGARRAKQIAASASVGDYIMSADGKWSKTPAKK